MRTTGLVLMLGALAGPVLANDTTAQLGAGGLVFVTNDNIEMASEHLYISPTSVKVTYEFNNTSGEDQHILIAFPMPDVEGSMDFMVDVPVVNAGYDGIEIDDPNNIFGFKTTFNGEPVAAELHQYAFKNNIDYSKLLTKLGLPLTPFGGPVVAALNALPPASAEQLTHLGLVAGMEYDAGEGWKTDLYPAWTLRSAYSWEATFPPGMSEVVHTYYPSVGATVATTFMPQDDDDGFSKRRFAEYQDKYCVDDNLVATLKNKEIDRDGWVTYPYVENWISYIWSTGNNWSGPIGKFTLTIDKGKPENLVSFCGENVKKIGPTTFEMTAEDWYPPWDKELEILLLESVDWFDE